MLWTAGALRRSLWTDEFHSLYHVRQADWPSFFESVKSDNHPPLSFAAERLSVGLFGDSELALRLPSMLCGLVLLGIVWRLATSLGLAGRVRACLVVLLSSFSYVIFTEARMYSWLALASAGLMLAIHRGLVRSDRGSEDEPLPWAVSWWTAIGLHSHYYFIHDLFVLGLCVVGIAVARPDLRRGVLRGLPPVLLGVLLWVPWGLYGFSAQLTQDYPPGGHESGWVALAQSFYHLLFMNTGFAPGWVGSWLALPVAGLAICAGVLGVWNLARSSRAGASREGELLWLLVGVLAFGAPAWACLASEWFERASFGWRYVAGSLGPLALCIAAGLEGLPTLPRRALSLGIGLSLAGGVALNLWGGEREDYRAAVARILSEARPGDAVVVKRLWDPDPEGSPTGWDYYSRRLSVKGSVAPTLLHQEEIRGARDHSRVWIFQRDPYSQFALRALRQWFVEEREETLGLDLQLYRFETKKAP